MTTCMDCGTENGIHGSNCPVHGLDLPDQRGMQCSTAPVKPSKYHREVRPGIWVDVYDVLKAFDVRNAALQHLIKKALAPGQRGHKDLMTDLDDIIASAKRAKELEQ